MKQFKTNPEITPKELALMLNFTQNALVELLIWKGIITMEELTARTKQQAEKHKFRKKRN